MISFDSLPQARVVSQGGRQFAPPPAPPEPRELGPVARVMRDALAVAIGMWPLTGVLLLMAGLLFMAGMSGQP